MGSDEYFKIMFVETIDRLDYIGYDLRPVFNAISYDGDLINKRINAKNIFIFKPYELHSVIYYGAEYLVIVRSVYYNRKKR